tara:strand:+ start:93 stop:260 length:168 start_codon:yes stop_codon:yes gene_type:complete
VLLIQLHFQFLQQTIRDLPEPKLVAHLAKEDVLSATEGRIRWLGRLIQAALPFLG